MLVQVSDSRGQHVSLQSIIQDNGELLRGLAGAFDSGTPFTRRQATLMLSNGQTITVDYTVTPLQASAEPLLLIELQPLDRLLRISREETQLSTHESSRNLIRGLAHEIKNPLGGLRGAAQLLSLELPNTELQDYTNVIIAEADRLRNLVDKLLGPNALPQRQATNIHAVVERVSQLLSAEVGSGIQLIKDYDPSIPEFEADDEQLIQAVLNIARNAAQALTEAEIEAPTISFKTRIIRRFTIAKHHHKLVCKLSITDNGNGIPAEILPNIFFPMVTGPAEGTGLGLSISQSIVHQHDGLIECESQPGSTQFSLFLPLELA
mgnify:CR=1 FL=1